MPQHHPHLHAARGRAAAALFALLCLAFTPARAAGFAPMPAAITCAALGQIAIPAQEGAAVTLSAAAIIPSPKGEFCEIRGVIAPAIRFAADLPIAHWSRRYVQTGCGGLCGSLHVRLENATGCAPAQDGTLALASDDMGHESPPGDPGAANFGADPQARIDFAYRGNHLTARTVTYLITRFYGAPPQDSYFTGCSDGGREALEEAERYPTDFNGIIAGAPAMNFQVQNSFYHAWMALANTGPDGKPILRADRLPILHRAVIAACDTLDGDQDGLLTDPRLCHFDPATIQCPPGARTTTCLTPAEVAVARKFYQGPLTPDGAHLTNGGPQYGSELAWQGVYVPEPGTDFIFSRAIAAGSISGVIYPSYSAKPQDLARFAFTRANFAKVAALAPLNDAGNPDIAAFIARGGKLILYHGWSDPHISPINTIAYFQALGRTLGAARRDGAVRLYLLPGMYHCGGGDGFWQMDLLSPMLAWVEQGAAPGALMAATGVLPPFRPGPGGPPPMLLPPPRLPAQATRPIFPFPAVPRYRGTGSLDDPGSFAAAAPLLHVDYADNWLGAESFYAPDFQADYTVKDHALARAAR